MKCHLPGVFRDLFRLYFLHIGKSNNQHFLRAGGMVQAKKSAKSGQNGLCVCVLTSISKKAGCLIFQYVSLNRPQMTPGKWHVECISFSESILQMKCASMIGLDLPKDASKLYYCIYSSFQLTLTNKFWHPSISQCINQLLRLAHPYIFFHTDFSR